MEVVMRYSFGIVVPPTDVVGNPVETDLTLMSGIIKNLQIFFPKGCARTIRALFYDATGQILPTTADTFYSLDGNTVNIPCYYVNAAGAAGMYIRAWTIGSSYSHTLTVYVEIVPFDSPDGGN
jgi:hypothetical protein